MGSNNQGSVSKHWRVVLVVFVLVRFIRTVTAQVTFNRQWVRGQYPENREVGEISEYQRAAKAILSQLDQRYKGYVRQKGKADAPIPVDAHVLEKIFQRISIPKFDTEGITQKR